MWEDIYVCECDGEAVALYDWRDMDWIGLALWRYGAGYTFGWRSQLRHIWYIIRHGHPYVDDIILSAENARSLGEKLIELAKGSSG
jgi:hypothetical protein